MADAARAKSALDFWRRGIWIVALYIFQGVFAEDIIVAMNAEHENLSWFISLLTVASQFGVAYVSIALTRVRQRREHGPTARMLSWRYWASRYRWEYAVAGVSIVLYQLLNNSVTFYLNFNTVQLFKTSKIVFVMLLSRLLLHHNYSARASFFATALGAGLYMLSRADMKSSKPRHPDASHEEHLATIIQGFAIMFVSLVFIAANNILQEAVMRQHVWSCRRPQNRPHTPPPLSKQKAGELKDELIFFCNLFTTTVLFAGSFYNGELRRGVLFFARNPPRLVVEQSILLGISALGQRLMLDLAQLYGSTSATIVVTVRKTITFTLSVLVFPKPFTRAHAMAVAVVSVAACLLQLQIMRDEQARDKAKARNAPPLNVGGEQEPFLLV